MPENPYEPPQEPSGPPKRNLWAWACLAGLAAMVASGLALCGSAKVQQSGVSFLNASWAMFLAAVFCSGFLALIGGSLGWLIAWAKDR